MISNFLSSICIFLGSRSSHLTFWIASPLFPMQLRVLYFIRSIQRWSRSPGCLSLLWFYYSFYNNIHLLINYKIKLIGVLRVIFWIHQSDLSISRYNFPYNSFRSANQFAFMQVLFFHRHRFIAKIFIVLIITNN